MFYNCHISDLCIFKYLRKIKYMYDHRMSSMSCELDPRLKHDMRKDMRKEKVFLPVDRLG